MLSDNLEKIKEVKESTPYPQTNENKSEVSSDISNNNAERDITNEGSNKKPRKENIEEVSEENGIKNSENKDSKDVSNKNATRKPETVESDPSIYFEYNLKYSFKIINFSFICKSIF